MNKLHYTAAAAAILQALSFIFGFVVLIMGTLSAPDGWLLDPAMRIEAIASHSGLFYIWNLVIYVLFGMLLVVQVVAMQKTVKASESLLFRISTVLAYIWGGLVIASGMVANVGFSFVLQLHEAGNSSAGNIWLAIDSVRNGLGGGNEIVGGLWVLLLSISALKSGDLTKAVNILGIVAGAAGVISLVPVLADAGAIFGIGLIVWYIWVGIVMLRQGRAGQS